MSKTTKPPLAAFTICPPKMKSNQRGRLQLTNNSLQHVLFDKNTLLLIFQYLKIQDLLRVRRVCTMWNKATSYRPLWKTVRINNLQISSFKGMANALQKHKTVHLDLRKMLLPSNSNDDIWKEFPTQIKKVKSLRTIQLRCCPAFVVERLALSNPKLEVINADAIQCDKMNLSRMARFKNLQELRLQSTFGFVLMSQFSTLSKLKKLKHLSLTAIWDLNKLNIEVIANLVNLESLELGDCLDLRDSFGSEILCNLVKLRKLRLEKGLGKCDLLEILKAVKRLPHLEQLELVNFDIKAGFDKAIGACTNIKKLLIIPTYLSNTGTTNYMVIGGVFNLRSTLSHFMWGLPLELIQITQLFLNRHDLLDERVRDNCISILKTVPEGINQILPTQESLEVDYFPLSDILDFLNLHLPTAHIKILKLHFHESWRLRITDTSFSI